MTNHVISGLALSMSFGRGGGEDCYNDERKFPNPIFPTTTRRVHQPRLWSASLIGIIF